MENQSKIEDEVLTMCNEAQRVVESANIRVNQTISDGTRYIAICELTDESGNLRYFNLPLFNTVYTAQEWARRDLYQR